MNFTMLLNKIRQVQIWFDKESYQNVSILANFRQYYTIEYISNISPISLIQDMLLILVMLAIEVLLVIYEILVI